MNRNKYERSLSEVEIFLKRKNLHQSKDSIDITKREQAIREVLRRIPKVHYEKLKEENMHNGIQWMFIGVSSYAHKIRAYLSDKRYSDDKYAILIILPKYYEWERIPVEIAEAAVAHELAHIVLGHYDVENPNSDEYTEDEEKCIKLVTKWGFKEEQEKQKRFFGEFELYYK